MATVTYDYPTSQELLEIEQVLLPRLEQDRMLLSLMPRENADASVLKWEQMDNFVGLQQLRGIGGAPTRIAKTGSKGYRMDPGYYGEFETLDEQELTERRKLGTFGTPIEISDLVGIAQRKLLQREMDRMEVIVATLLTTGTFSVSSPTGGTIHTDMFNIGTFTASPAWTDLVNSTPVSDLRAVQLQQRGQSASFGRGAKLLMNQKYINYLLKNANADDIGGRYRINGGDTINNLEGVNKILLENDLPQIIPYDAGYLNDSGTFTPFIADGKAILVGQRPAGQQIGAYRLTRNVNNPNMEPGSYTRVIDRGENTIPRVIEVHRGHNGGPVIYFPGAVIAMNI